MSLIRMLRNSRALSLLAVCLTALPSFPQNNQSTGAPQQTPPSTNTQSQQDANSQTPPGGITPSMLALPPARKLPTPTGVDYSKEVNHFPNFLAAYTVRNLPEATYTNAPRLEQMIQNGRIMLSLNDAIALGMADNLDLAIARYILPIADTEILRTKSGAGTFGVPLGLVSGTPGGGGIAVTGGASGTGAGGTSVGAGGVGVGASGVVNSTLGAGPAIDNWDPTLTGTLQETHAVSPTTSAFLNGGAATIGSNATTSDFTYTQGFSYGSLLTVDYRNSRTTSSSPVTNLTPLLQSSFSMSIRQHILQGWGWAVNRRFITIARDNKRAAEESFKLQVSSTVSQIEDIYWDLVAAYEDVKVKERSLALDQKTLSDNEQQVKIGTMAPISVVQAKSAVATDQQNLLASRNQLFFEQLLMKNAISRNMVSGSDLMKAEIVPTDTVVVPEQEPQYDVEGLIQRAFQNHPSFIEQKITLKERQLSIKGVNNLLRPSVDLIGFYGASSIAGVQNPLLVCTPTRTTNCAPPIPATGFSNAFTNLFNSSAPDKGVAVQVVIPIRNRAAEAEQVRSQMEYRQAELNFKQSQNNLALNIRNEVFQLQQDRARILAAREAQTFAEQNLDAEQKKYALGASTSFNVMSMQAALAVAQESTINAEITYAKQRVQLELDTAQTLDNNNIIIQEAVTGNIKTQPNVPGIGPNTFIEQTGPPPANPQKPPR